LQKPETIKLQQHNPLDWTWRCGEHLTLASPYCQFDDDSDGDVDGDVDGVFDMRSWLLCIFRRLHPACLADYLVLRGSLQAWYALIKQHRFV
jgi:hypothetical protein